MFNRRRKSLTVLACGFSAYVKARKGSLRSVLPECPSHLRAIALHAKLLLSQLEARHGVLHADVDCNDYVMQDLDAHAADKKAASSVKHGGVLALAPCTRTVLKARR